MPDLLTRPIENVLSRLEGARSSGDGWTALCPSHADKTPSLSISESEDGKVLIHCHGGCQTEDVLSSVGLSMSDLMPPQMNGTLSSNGHHSPKSPKAEPAPIPDDIVVEYEANITAEWRDYLQRERVLSNKVIDCYRLGIKGNRVAMPVFDKEGNCRNLRFWLPPQFRQEGDAKIMSYRAGYGIARLYPISQIEYDSLLLVEGEMDALAAISHGFNAITTTSGASTFPEEIASRFSGKSVTLLMDHDTAGREGAEKRAESLVQHGAKVKIARWPNDKQ
jgi:putative DNA primase/helicase